MVKKIFNVLIFISILSPFNLYAVDTPKEPKTLEEALKVYSTPFIDAYRARYNHDNSTTIAAALFAKKQCLNEYHIGSKPSFKIPCTQKDIENIKKLADYGDMPSLQLTVFLINDTKLKNAYYKVAADNGSIEGLVNYGEIIIKDNFDLGKNYLEKAKATGHINGYMAMARLYSEQKNIKGLCAVIDEGYKKFGFEFLAPLLLNKQKSKLYYSGQASVLFSKFPDLCLQKTSKKLLSEVDTELSKLYAGYLLTLEKDYIKAKEVFEKLYVKSDDVNIKYNAGYCLGAIYYLGEGVKNDTSYGVKLMQESVDMGYDMSYFIPQIQNVPNDILMLKYQGYCDLLLLYASHKNQEY